MASATGPTRDLLAGRGDDVQLALVGQLGDLLGEAEQPVGLARHRRDDDDHVVPLALRRQAAPRDVADALDVADRSSAVFLNDEQGAAVLRLSERRRQDVADSCRPDGGRARAAHHDARQGAGGRDGPHAGRRRPGRLREHRPGRALRVPVGGPDAGRGRGAVRRSRRARPSSSARASDPRAAPLRGPGDPGVRRRGRQPGVPRVGENIDAVSA